MNKLIRELADQAGFYVANGKIYIPSTSEEITTCQKKFTELIVRECVNIINKNMPEFTCKEDYENLIRKAGRMDAIDEIEQHFGVEQ